MERKLATIKKIDDIIQIKAADAIECAIIGGWKVVVKKGLHHIDELVVYCEVDSWIPNIIAPFLSRGQEPREYNGVKGERLRTIKLRGCLSQGLILAITSEFAADVICEDGIDVTDILCIQKWEAPINAQLAGVAKGNFPSFLHKTDQDRIQNLSMELKSWQELDLHFEVTEKLEGSSCTVYVNDNEFGVCSRNLDLKDTESNAFWLAAKKYNMQNDIINNISTNIAIQAELIGEKIQGNIYNIKGHELQVFDIFNIDTQTYLNSKDRLDICEFLTLQHVPIISKSLRIKDFNMDLLLTFADDKSKLYNTNREGLVFKCIEDPSISFKVISNNYLLKQD